MSKLPASSPFRHAAGQGVEEATRVRLAEQLNDAYARQQVGDADFQQMLDIVQEASTMGELAPVAERLPAIASYDEPEMVREQGRGPGELADTQRGLVLSKYLLVGGGLLALVAIVLLAILL